MKRSRRAFLHLAAGAAALPALAHAVRAQAWPARAVRLVVGFPPGGGADAAARIVASRLSEIWGQQVVIENKGGAGGNIAIDAVAHAPGDGYTMLFGVPPLVTNRFLFSTLTYDPDADFAPVTLIGTYGNLLVVPNSSPVKSLHEFIALAKANPGRLTYASPGVGTTPQLAGELLKHKAGIEITHVPYRGTGAGALTDVIAGRVDSMFNTTGSLLQPARAGQVRGIAVTSAERPATAAEFPTFAESGVPGFDVSGWYAILVPARTPPGIIGRMHTDTAVVLSEPAIRSKFDNLGVTLVASTPAELAARMRTETDMWGPIIKAANIKAE
jgi:tripartite-type tricarboxylate transporter receptor subunit TctC